MDLMGKQNICAEVFKVASLNSEKEIRLLISRHFPNDVSVAVYMCESVCFATLRAKTAAVNRLCVPEKQEYTLVVMIVNVLNCNITLGNYCPELNDTAVSYSI